MHSFTAQKSSDSQRKPEETNLEVHVIAMLVFTWQSPVAPQARLGPVSLSVPFSSSRVGVLPPSATTMALPMLMNNAECGPSNALQELSKRFNTDRGLSQVCKALS